MMKVRNLDKLGSEPAPREWAEFEEIQKQCPLVHNAQKSLQRLSGTNICVWMISVMGGVWINASNYFIVEEEK